jgi:hypothetical protein
MSNFPPTRSFSASFASFCSKYTKGMVWVNGHNLDRYWSIGPQLRLYCPAGWLAGSSRAKMWWKFGSKNSSKLAQSAGWKSATSTWGLR